MTFRRFLIRGFRQKRSFKVMAKNYFFAALARSALRRVRVKSDLLDETAIEASVVVACTKGSFHKKRCTYFAPSLYFLVKLTRPRLVHCTHAAIRPPTTPTAVYSTSYTTSTALATVIADVIAVSYTHAEAYALLCFHWLCSSVCVGLCACMCMYVCEYLCNHVVPCYLYMSSLQESVVKKPAPKVKPRVPRRPVKMSHSSQVSQVTCRVEFVQYKIIISSLLTGNFS